ncbi:MAG TPA: hotdog fold thioesterase [Bacteroidia bacterium]|nr:hotdog fold thioesterase [Bacteroidia bacterium]HNT79902.1 hotdog fold thioesterase [Bacteroidia bacterium]
MGKRIITAKGVISAMFNNDSFSQWLGIEVLETSEGYCKLKMQIRKEMLNGFLIAHGGICYALADSALAFASNSHGRKSVSVETSISHLVALKEGDNIFAEAIEKHKSNKIGVYEVVIRKNDETIVALFKGTVYRTSQEWMEE